MSKLLDVQDLSIVFGRSLQAVTGASFTLAAGATLGLVGESGSGKTTLSKAVIGLIAPASGSVFFEGKDIAALGREERRRFRRRAQMIFQDPASSLSPRMTIRRALEEPLRIHGLPLRENWPRVQDSMSILGLGQNLLDSYPHQLSGGQARRVGIARALTLEPRLLVADEPTAGLDISVQGDLLNLMNDLQRRLGLAYLIVSHNLTMIGAATDETAVMYLGKLVEIGATRDVFARPAHPYTHALLAANPQIDPERRRAKEILSGETPSVMNRPSGCPFRTRCRYAAARCVEEEPLLRPLDGARSAACHFPLN